MVKNEGTLRSIIIFMVNNRQRQVPPLHSLQFYEAGNICQRYYIVDQSWLWAQIVNCLTCIFSRCIAASARYLQNGFVWQKRIIKRLQNFIRSLCKTIFCYNSISLKHSMYATNVTQFSICDWLVRGLNRWHICHTRSQLRHASKGIFVLQCSVPRWNSREADDWWIWKSANERHIYRQPSCFDKPVTTFSTSWGAKLQERNSVWSLQR
jgi:hypothetical protein